MFKKIAGLMTVLMAAAALATPALANDRDDFHYTEAHRKVVRHPVRRDFRRPVRHEDKRNFRQPVRHDDHNDWNRR